MLSEIRFEKIKNIVRITAIEETGEIIDSVEFPKENKMVVKKIEKEILSVLNKNLSLY